MSIAFHFTKQGTSFRSDPEFSTGVAQIGEMYLRSPEAFGYSHSEDMRSSIAALFPNNGSIECALQDLQQGTRNSLLEQIRGIRVYYGSKY